MKNEFVLAFNEGPEEKTTQHIILDALQVAMISHTAGRSTHPMRRSKRRLTWRPGALTIFAEKEGR
jgi:hypothetical protein